MEIKVKITKCDYTTYWYEKYIGEEVIVDTNSIREILDEGEIFTRILLTDKLKDKLKFDAKPYNDNDYGIYKHNTNFEQIVRKEKLIKLLNETSK